MKSMSKKHRHAAEEVPQEEVQEELPQELTEETASQQPATDQPDYYEKYVRLSADFENFRKRTEREKAAFLAYGKKGFVEKLLPAYEVLLREQKKMQASDKPDTTQNDSLRAGFNMVLGELTKAFESEGVKKMDVVGTP